MELTISFKMIILWRNDNFDDEDDDAIAEVVEDGEENEEKPKATKKETKKPIKQKTKLQLATAQEKNNSSLLSFFQKPQKRPIIDTYSNVDVVSNFLLNRNLKFCTSF